MCRIAREVPEAMYVSVRGPHWHRPCPKCGYATRFKQWPTACRCGPVTPDPRPPLTNSDHLSQNVPVVEDPHRLQMFAGLAHPHQHRTAPMQIHADTRRIRSQGPPLSWNNVNTSSMRARDGHEERRPRSFMTSECNCQLPGADWNCKRRRKQI